MFSNTFKKLSLVSVLALGLLMPEMGQARGTRRQRAVYAPATSAVVNAPAPAVAQPAAPSVSALKENFAIERGRARLARMSQQDAQRFQALLQHASTVQERMYLVKTLAVGYPMATVEKFAGIIHGKSSAWMEDMLRLTNSSKRLGVKQQWSTACGPTTVQALLGELDPIYAYRVHVENPNFYRVDEKDAMKMNPRLAKEQKTLLESADYHGAKGKAVSRSTNGGVGRTIDDLLNKISRHTGVTYKWMQQGKDYPTSRAMNDLDWALVKGVPVPVLVRTPDNSNRHFVLATGVYRENGQKVYVLHDPWTGQTVRRTAQQFTSGTLNLAGNNVFHGILRPSLLPL